MPGGAAHAVKQRPLTRTLSDRALRPSGKSKSSDSDNQSPFYENKIERAEGNNTNKDSSNGSAPCDSKESEDLLVTQLRRNSRDIKKQEASLARKPTGGLFFGASGGGPNKHIRYEDTVASPGGGGGPSKQAGPSISRMAERGNRKQMQGTLSSGKTQRNKPDESGPDGSAASSANNGAREREDGQNSRPPIGKSWKFIRSNSLPTTVASGNGERSNWWEGNEPSATAPVVEEEMEPEPYPPNLERGVKVRKKSMAGKTEVRILFVRGDTIELVNPEKRMFRSQSKIFPLSELTAVVAQDERSLSLTLGSKGLHLTLADRQTKDFLWEHLRKMREQAREQAKASRLTRASSIDHINIGDDVKGTTKKKRRFKRSQSCNDAPGPVGSDNDDGDKDFLDEEGGVGGSVGGGSTGGGSGGRGGASLAARGRKFFKRISRSGSLPSSGGGGIEDDLDLDGQGEGDEGRATPDDWSDSESLGSADSDEDDVDDVVDDVYVADGQGGGPTGDGEDASPESTTKPSSTDRPPPTSPLLPLTRGNGSQDSGMDSSGSGASVSSGSGGSNSPETEVAVTEPQQARRGGGSSSGTTVPAGVLKTSRSSGGVGPLANLKPVRSSSAKVDSEEEGLGDPMSPVPLVRFSHDRNGNGDVAGKERGETGGVWGKDEDGSDAATGGDGRALKKASTLPAMPRVSLLSTGARPKGGRKSVQFQVPENEGLDSDTSDSPSSEFLSNPDIRFEVPAPDRAAMHKVLDQLRTALKRATSSEKGFTASGASLGLMPMRIARPGTMSGRPQRQNSGSSTSTLTLSPADGGGATIGSGTALGSTGSNSSAGGTLGPSSGTSSSANVSDSQPQGRLGKQYGSGLPSLLACLKGLRRAGSALSERHFFCYAAGFTELISTAEKAWVAISKRSPPDVTAIDRVKAAVIEARQLAEDHGGSTGGIPHSGARLVVRMVRGLLERDGERLKELSRRMATAARAAIVVGDVFDDEAAGELQLRYMSCLDGAPLDKAARTHEKLRTLGELLSPFLTPESKDCVSPIGIDDMSALLWRAHDMLYVRPDANAGRRVVFKSTSAPLLSPRRDMAPAPILCPEAPQHHVPRSSLEERIAAGLLGRVSPWDPPMIITGAPGVGKTVLASSVARRFDVRRHFRDGIFWLPAGKDATERLPWLLEHLAVQLVLSSGAGESRASRLGGLGGRGKQDDEVEVELPWGVRGPREGEVAAFLAAHLATRGLTCLLVVDDLWDRESLDQVRDLGFHVMVTANCKGQLWTQHGAGLAATLGSEVVAADRMDDEQCKLLLQRCSNLEAGEWNEIRDSEPVDDIIKLCRHGPHSLVMVGSTLHRQARHFSWSATRDLLDKSIMGTRVALQNGGAQDQDYVALYSAGRVCIHKLPDHVRDRYMHLAILPRHVPAPEQMLESLWDTDSDEVFDEVLEKLRSQALLQSVTIMGDHGRYGHVTSNTQMDFIQDLAAAETVEHAAVRMSLYLGRLKVLKSGLGRKAGGKYLAMGRCGLVSCWAEVEKRFGFTALEAYAESIRAYREKAVASGQGSSLKLAAAVKLLADYLLLTEEKISALEYYKEALARVEARTEHDRAKPQTQLFSAQVLKGIARCLVAEGQLEEAEQRFQKAMGMENARNPGASRAMLEYSQPMPSENEPLEQILRQMGHFDRASAVGGQALALVQTGPTGPHSAESAVCVASLAGLAAQQGKAALSEELYRRSLAVALRVFGPRHPAVAAETNVLAVFLVEHGRNREAEACYRQSMEIWERTLGPYSPELASGLNNLAILLFMEDRPGEAAATFQRSLDIRQRVLPPDSLETAQGLNNLALLYTSQGQDPAAAERLHREALAIREARLGRYHPEVAQTCHNLALLLLKTGPGSDQSPGGIMTRNPEETYGKQWKWEKVGDGGSGGALVNGERKSNSNGWRSNEEGAKGEQTWGKADGGGGCEVYRWRHTEAVRLLERALAVHRETLGDEHPVTEESMQALAAAGGSVSPKVRPEPIMVGTPLAGHAVDPPPPSLECLASFKTDQAQERQRQLDEQAQREQEQRVKWEQAQVAKVAQEHARQQKQQHKDQLQKQQRELLRQQQLEQQALSREQAEAAAKEARMEEETRLAHVAQAQQRQIKREEKERRRMAAAEAATVSAERRRTSSGNSPSSSAATGAARPEAGAGALPEGSNGRSDATRSRSGDLEPSSAPPLRTSLSGGGSARSIGPVRSGSGSGSATPPAENCAVS